MIVRTESGWRVEGPIKMDTASALLDDAEGIWHSETRRIDLSGISDADSAAIAVLLAWKRRANREGKEISFHGATDSVRSLANLYDVADLLFPQG